MPPRDRLDESELAELRAQIAELQVSIMAGFTSITRGSLRVASAEGLIVEGSAVVTGLLDVIGRVLVRGLGILEVDSLIKLTGMLQVIGEILVPAGGKITVGDIRIEGGRIYVGEGANQIVIDGATGRITSGQVRIEGGKIYVGMGASSVVLDGDTGKVRAGTLTIDPTISGGAVTFANGAQVFTDAATIQVYLGNSVVQIADDYARLQNGGYVIQIDGRGARISPGAVDSISGTGAILGTVIQDASGYLRRADGT